jgi:hypothetical protein
VTADAVQAAVLSSSSWSARIPKGKDLLVWKLRLQTLMNAILSAAFLCMGFSAGFGGSTPESLKPGSSTAPSSSQENSAKSSGSGGDGKKGDGKKPGQQDGGSGFPMGSLVPIAILTLLGVSLLSKSSQRGEEKSWQEVRNEYLAAGRVVRFEVFNKEFARVVVKGRCVSCKNICRLGLSAL